MLFVSSGYFIYDFFDMVFNQKLSQSWELLFHHTVVGLSGSAHAQKNKLWLKKHLSQQGVRLVSSADFLLNGASP